jgi:hypothetical protein
LAFANMNVNPNSSLRIIRQLSDPYDSGTYYVRAVVRNSATGDVLDTIDLTDSGSQRFVGTYQTGADASGSGFYIDVTTYVFTDAGYTTASENYSIESNVYHVIQQWNHAAGLGGGLDVNYEKVRRIVQEELGKLVIPEPIQPRDLTPELLGIERRLKESVGAIKIPEQKEVDLEPVKQEVRSSVDNAINTLLLAVDAKEVTPATDLTALEAEVASIRTTELNALATELTALRERLDAVLALKEQQDNDVALARNKALEFVDTLSGRTRKEEPDPEELRRARARKLMGV